MEEKKDLWEQGEVWKDCNNCKWENEALEEEVGDGYAPCERCSRWDGKR